MEWEDTYKLDLLQTEMERISSTNEKYKDLEERRQNLLADLKAKLSKENYELIEKLVDVTEIQNYLMIRAVLRIGLI